MFNRHGKFSLMILNITLMISAFMGIISFVLCLEFHGAFIGAYIVFVLTAVYSSLKVIIGIVSKDKPKTMYILIQSIMIIVVGYMLMVLPFSYISSYRLRRSIMGSGHSVISQVTRLTGLYSETYGHMPHSHNWLESLQAFYDGPRRVFSADIPQIRHVESVIAYNEHLSGNPVEDLAGHIILFFEADGDKNLSGGPELMAQERHKDGYFLFQKDRFIYVSYVDGTVARYRLHDGAVSFGCNQPSAPA